MAITTSSSIKVKPRLCLFGVEVITIVFPMKITGLRRRTDSTPEDAEIFPMFSVLKQSYLLVSVDVTQNCCLIGITHFLYHIRRLVV